MLGLHSAGDDTTVALTAQAPARLVVPTCIGCGAMSRPGGCELGCSERRRDLVRAGAYDELIATEDLARDRLEVLRQVIDVLFGDEPGDDDWASAYRALQMRARAVPGPASDDPRRVDVSEPTQAATTWWCPECDGVDAPQPCLEICVWREVEWIDRADYEAARERVLTMLQTERRMEAMVKRLAWTTPREGRWEESWRALRSEASHRGLPS